MGHLLNRDFSAFLASSGVQLMVNAVSACMHMIFWKLKRFLTLSLICLRMEKDSRSEGKMEELWIIFQLTLGGWKIVFSLAVEKRMLSDPAIAFFSELEELERFGISCPMWLSLFNTNP